MVDIETGGLAYGSAILEIAAAEFDPFTGEVLRSWSSDVDPLDAARCGLTTDSETLAFHARKGTRFTGTSTLWRALNEFDTFLHLNSEKVDVWAWGADFEVLHIKANCEAIGIPFPWEYYRTRDARTAWSLAFPDRRPPSRPHRAAADVAAQIRDLSTALNALAFV